MPIEGPLAELGIHDVLQLLELSQKTGILTLSSDRRKHWGFIHFVGGKVVAAFKQGGDARPLLGHLLLRDGKVTEGELERAREQQREDPDRRLGEILVEMGSVTRDDVAAAVRFLIEETIYELMSWEEGYFSFRETDEVLDPPPLVEVPTGSLLMEGARRVDEWTTLEDKVPGPDVVPSLLSPETGRAPSVLDLRPEEWEVLAEIDGQKDLRALATALGRSEFDLAKTIFGLVNTGVVEVLAAPRSATAAPSAREESMAEIEGLLASGELGRARMLAEELVRHHREEAPVLELYGRVLLRQRRHRAALEAFGKVVELDPLSAEAHRRLGFAALRSGELERAIAAWETCVRLSGDDDLGAPRVERSLAALRALKAECDREEGE